ncbi:MAG TPA: metabolite traffic protein EboE [Hanamia sp.]|nr:metabolite traffic protein EboE [Hanamia sp.]
MFTVAGHLTYCTNIHQGETWKDHFASIKKYFPSVKENISPDKPMGIGLRLSNEASLELIKKENLSQFKEWLKAQDAYVFTMNGFPYGGFHNTIVKDQVHTPDWTTNERAVYTIRLFHILSALLPAEMDGGVSTSPLSYRLWFETKNQLDDCRETATKNVIHVIENLIDIHQTTGKLLHLDIEPEPDGLLETGEEFLDWFENDLLRLGIPVIKEKLKISGQHSEGLIKEHLRLCYDVCHFAIGYEPHKKIINEVLKRGIKIGKIQISAALKSKMDLNNRNSIKQSFENFNEPTYLHQVVAKTIDGKFLRYPDLPQAIKQIHNPVFTEWRVHFHVPIFTEKFDLLSSTQDEIKEVLTLQKSSSFTNHLEVETYTWDVLQSELKLPIQDSITREMQWVTQMLDN